MSHSFTRALAAVALLPLLGAGCIQFGNSSSSQAASPAGMFRSLDKAESFVPVVAFPTPQGVKSIAGVNVYRVFTDPSDPNALYLTTRNQGLFYTFNNGDEWNRVDVLAGKYIYALVVDPQNKCVVYASDEGHIYKTSDCMRTWQLIYTEERPSQRAVSLAVDFASSNTVYAALAGGDILRSMDGGKSWQTIQRLGFAIQYLAADPLAAKRLYVAAYGRGLLRSDDQGITWSDLGSAFANYSSALDFYRLILHPTKRNALYWVSKYGILHSEDAGASWSEYKLITPPGSVNIYAFAVNGKNDKEMYYVGTILDEKGNALRSTLYKTVDGGTNWLTKKLPTNTIPVFLYVHPKDDRMIFMGFTGGV